MLKWSAIWNLGMQCNVKKSNHSPKFPSRQVIKPSPFSSPPLKASAVDINSHCWSFHLPSVGYSSSSSITNSHVCSIIIFHSLCPPRIQLQSKMIYPIMLNHARSVNWEFIRNHCFSLHLILAAASVAWPGSKPMQQMTVALFHSPAAHYSAQKERELHILHSNFLHTTHTHTYHNPFSINASPATYWFPNHDELIAFIYIPTGTGTVIT